MATNNIVNTNYNNCATMIKFLTLIFKAITENFMKK